MKGFFVISIVSIIIASIIGILLMKNDEKYNGVIPNWNFVTLENQSKKRCGCKRWK